MRHRLFYVLPDIDSARGAMNDLLLSRIEARHIRFMTAGMQLPDDLPEASCLQKTDMISGGENGAIVGGVLGFLLGIFIGWYFDIDGMSGRAAFVVLATLVGVLFGGWAASLAGAALPNTRLKAFERDLEQGRILLIVDVPNQRVEKIEQVMAERHREMRFGGEDSHIPVFP